VRTLVAVAVTVLAGTMATPVYAAGVPTYRPLEGLPGPATDINDRGQVVGWTETNGWRPYLWDRGVVTDLGSLSTQPGTEEGQALDVNNRGQIVGYSATKDWAFHAFLWDRGVLTDLGTFAGGTFSKAVHINDRGQITGWSDDAAGVSRSVIWQDGVMTEVPGGDINNRGQMIGGESLYSHGGQIPLGFGATTLNNVGWVAGYSWVEQEYYRPYLWRRGVTTELRSLGAAGAYPVDLNDRGEVLGVTVYANEGAEAGLSTPAATSSRTAQCTYGGTKSPVNNGSGRAGGSPAVRGLCES
jgi:probable HAF family extracellular repeat protein